MNSECLEGSLLAGAWLPIPGRRRLTVRARPTAARYPRVEIVPRWSAVRRMVRSSRTVADALGWPTRVARPPARHCSQDVRTDTELPIGLSSAAIPR